MSTEVNKSEWRRHSHNFDKSISFHFNPLFQFWMGVWRSYTLAETYSIPEVVPAEVDQDACTLVFSHAPRITRPHQADGLGVETFLV